MTIIQLDAWEVLDSRGRPTVKVRCEVEGGAAEASVPSGASTGTAEALELRDGETSRYGGLGCRNAVANVKGPIALALLGNDFADQAAVDRAMTALDGTPNKSRLGANAILGVSIAFARACAAALGVPLYQHFSDLLGAGAPTLPQLTINLFSGGKHAGHQVPIQDVLVVPVAAKTIDQGLAMTYAVLQAAARLCREKYGMRALSADEGGLAPPFPDAQVMLADAVHAIERAGFTPGNDVALALDVASTHFYHDGVYELDGRKLDSADMIGAINGWVRRFPIISVEDGLFEEDWHNWPTLRRAIEDRAIVLGDDFLCTNPDRIRRAAVEQSCNALLLKVNQIGTLTEAAEAYRLARSAGWKVTISARSGETEDDWLADLAVGWRGDQIKVGSIRQSERLAKYNRLLRIESETGFPVAR